MPGMEQFKVIEISANLFSQEGCSYAHCISEDCNMRAGIALQFARNFVDFREDVMKEEPSVGNVISLKRKDGHHVFNLVTKQKYWQKPKYQDLEQCLINLKFQMYELGVTALAIPRLGCGLDNLCWPNVKCMIERIFAHSAADIKITVCNPLGNK